MSNRLINESSPYLRQHGENPVDWYPWGEEAFQKAKAEDKPIAIILDTVKGKGVTAVEETMANHSMKVGPEVFDGWLAELREKQAAMKA